MDKSKKDLNTQNQQKDIDVIKAKKVETDIKPPDTNDVKYVRSGMIVIFLTFGSIILWSIFARLDTGVPLPGQVVLEANRKVIQHLEGGIVEKIYVKDGDFVKKGQILIKLSEVKAKAALNSYLAQYYEAIALQSRLIAENREQKSITIPPEIQKLSKDKREKLLSIQKEIFYNEMGSLEKEKKVAKQNIAYLKKQIIGLQDIIDTKKKLLHSYEIEKKEQESLYKEKLIDKTKLREIKRKIESIKSDILQNKTDILKANIQIDKIKTQLALKKQEFFTKIRKQLQDTQTKIEDLKARINEIQDKLSRTSIKAPVDGTVLGLRVHTIGAVITPGKPIMEIIPKNSRLIIEAKLPPQYIDYAHVGLKAKLTFPAFQLKGRFIKTIEGKVIFVSADSTIDKKGRSYYIVKLVVTKKGKEVLKKEHLKLLPGMPAGVVIIIGSQTPIEYLVKPMTLMVQKAFLEE